MACQDQTPATVQISSEPRVPVTDPTLGIPVTVDRRPAAHRLVTVGDSLTQGFMNGAVFRTDISWPAIVGYELGLTAGQFTFPTYEWPAGPGGLPLDLERMARAMQSRFGEKLDFWDIMPATVWGQRYMDAIEEYWERGQGSEPRPDGPPFHNMGVYGWDVLDVVMLDADVVADRIGSAKDDPVRQIVEDNNDRAARVVLDRASGAAGPRSVLAAAAEMGHEGGIETLVVAIGSNNALGSVVGLNPCWTPDDYASQSPEQRLVSKASANVWQPTHFAADWALLVEQLRAVGAQHVIVATVPSVTIAPIARGVAGKVRPDSRYFPYYTRPWITDDDFDPARDPRITEDQARAIDSAIDSYNATIIESVAAARRDGLDWMVFEFAGTLDRLATRRYINSPWTRPTWWTPYELPAALRALDPVPNTRFLRAGPEGRTDGGIFSLDGVHPTTIGYGLIAQEVIRVMELAGVAFRGRDGTPRVGPIDVDFDRLLRADSLVSDPPAILSPTLSLLGWLDQRFDWVRRVLPFT